MIMNVENVAAGPVGADQQAAWPQGDTSVDAMAHMSTDLDDLSNIFDIANFDLDSIQAVDGDHFGEPMQSIQTSAHATPYLDALSQPIQGSVAHDFADSTSHPSQLVDQHHPVSFQNTQFNGSAWQHFPSPQTQPFGNGMPEQYGANARIPPTPNSYEMHGEAGHFLQQQQQQAIFAQQKHMRNMELAQHVPHPAHFTPMTSPSGTPQYAMQPEFTTPGAYFSPLTSPALHAQMQPNGSQQVLQPQGYFTNPSTAPNSNAPSPVDLNSADVDMVDSAFAGEPSAKKGRKKLVTPRSVGPAARVRQSPIQKPQKRKSGLLSTVVPARELENTIVEGQVANNVSQPPSATARIAHTFDSSESGSISPEPLSEALMRPPPRPNTAMHSPINASQYSSASEVAARRAAAATPKSILSMRGGDASRSIAPNLESPGSSSLLATPTVNAVGNMSLDDLELPDPASSRQGSRRTSIILKADGQQRGPNLTVNTARKTPKLGPLSTPSSARPEDSPSIMPSPASASTPAALLKDKKAGGRSSRSLSKRGSVSGSASATASPALRPRISPSIKPLLPEGSLHSPTHALLLASKSNYQNLLEGNHLPGVNYPDSLSTGLTSKRTSHKVAEQGRRNRINEALKEMQSLIPAPNPATKGSSDENVPTMKEEDDSADAAGGDCDKDGGKESGSAKSNSSKAATVESANRYIRQLKESEASQRAAILALKQENEEIRRRLAEATGSAGDSDKDTEMPSIQEHEIAAEG